MPAGIYNFEIEQGVSFVKSLTWKDAAGAPINIAGYTIRMMARNDYGDTNPVITLSTVNPPAGITITDGANGQFQIALNAIQTAALNFTSVKYDLEMVAPGGAVIRLLQGEITLSREVTR